MPELNVACNNIPYTLGRMFSLYEQIQLAAAKANSSNINATIKDRYFNAASSNPSQVFNLLGKLSVSHLRVLRRSDPKLAGFLQGQLEELSIRVGTPIPPILTPPARVRSSWVITIRIRPASRRKPPLIPLRMFEL